MIDVPDRVQRFAFPQGYATTKATVELMARVLREQHTHARIRARVRSLFRDLPSMNYRAEVERVWEWVLSAVRYMRDPLGAEHITEPVSLDEQIDRGTAAEDCESMALYAATLLAAAGISSEFEIQGSDPSRPRRFRHCALAVKDPTTGERIPFDLVGALAYPGEFGLGDTLHHPGHPVERWNLDGERVDAMRFRDYLGCALSDSESDQLLETALGDAGFNFDQSSIDSIAHSVATVADQFGPYGQIVGGVITVADGVYDAATGKPKNAAAAAKGPISPDALKAIMAHRKALQLRPPPSSSPATKVAIGGAIGLALAAALGVL